MLSLTSATSGYSATSTSSFKVNILLCIYCGVDRVQFKWGPEIFKKCHRPEGHVVCFHRRDTGWRRSWQRWRPSGTFCVDRWTHCRSTLTAVQMPCSKTSCKETKVGNTRFSAACFWSIGGQTVLWQTEKSWINIKNFSFRLPCFLDGGCDGGVSCEQYF